MGKKMQPTQQKIMVKNMQAYFCRNAVKGHPENITMHSPASAAVQATSTVR